MSKYAERLAADEKAVKKEAAVLAEANAKAQVEQEISKLTAQEATLKAAYNQALGANPFSLARVLTLTKEQNQNAADLVVAKQILSSEFSA